jgi:hypothetical protein
MAAPGWYHAVTLVASPGQPPSALSPTTVMLSEPAEQLRPDARGQEQVAVFGKLAVDHANPVTASSTGRHGEPGRYEGG